MAIYDNMEFPPYEYREYPKTIDNPRDPDFPLQHGKGTVVNSKREEDAYWAAKNGVQTLPPAETEVEDKEEEPEVE